MRMTRTLPLAASAALILASCIPPEEVPPARFTPRQHGHPQEAADDYGQSPAAYPQDGGQTTRPGEYPVARPTANPNEVISPYEPYNIIDVEGFSSGQLARDPSNRMIFRVP